MQPRIYWFMPVLLLVCITLGCGSSSRPVICGVDEAVPLEAGMCLLFEDPIEPHRESFETLARQAVDRVTELMAIDQVGIRVIADPSQVIPELGIGGFNPSSDEVLLFVDLGFANLAASLEANLPALVAHELHHAMRRRTVGYGSTLLEAMVTEGLADHFSLEAFGGDVPPWSTALEPDDLEAWTSAAMKVWQNPYDHGAWFLGTDPNIPRWTGYAIGYALVQAYLDAHPGALPSQLSEEPAVSFVSS